MDQQVQIEYDRIKAGPHAGYFSFIHHKGPVMEHSSDVMERAEFILRDKLESQHYDRLRHIYSVPASAEKAYREAVVPAEKAYQEAVAPAGKAYREAVVPAEKAYREAVVPAEKIISNLIPNCAWDGSSILTSEVDNG